MCLPTLLLSLKANQIFRTIHPTQQGELCVHTLSTLHVERLKILKERHLERLNFLIIRQLFYSSVFILIDRLRWRRGGGGGGGGIHNNPYNIYIMSTFPLFTPFYFSPSLTLLLSLFLSIYLFSLSFSLSLYLSSSLSLSLTHISIS